MQHRRQRPLPRTPDHRVQQQKAERADRHPPTGEGRGEPALQRCRRSNDATTMMPTMPTAPAISAHRVGLGTVAKTLIRPAPGIPAEAPSGNAAQLGIAAELQRADVGGDRPAVGRRHPVGVRVHRTVAVGDHLQEMPVGRLAQPRRVEARRPRHPALTTIPSPSPVRPWQGAQKMSNRSRPRASNSADIGGRSAVFGIPDNGIAGDGAGGRNLLDPVVGEQSRGLVGLVFWLADHPLIAAHEGDRQADHRHRRRPHDGTSLIRCGRSPARNRRTASASNNGSVRAIARKNLSSDARSNCSPSNKGWCSRGSRSLMNIASNAAITASQHGNLERRQRKCRPRGERPAADVDRIIDGVEIPQQEVAQGPAGEKPGGADPCQPALA